MPFATHTDHWALATASTNALVIKSGDNPKKIPVNAVARDASGNITARAVAGADYAPSNNFTVKDDIADLSAFIFLGDVKGSSIKNLLAELSVSTGAEQEPAVAVSGVSVQSGASATSFRKVTLPTIALKSTTTAQILGAAFTLAGEGCDLNECKLTAKINPVVFKPNGVAVKYDFGGAVLEVTAKIVQNGATAPTVTAASGWVITDGPSEQTPESEYSVWTVTLTSEADGADPEA